MQFLLIGILCLTSFVFSAWASSAPPPFIITLDPGHGGSDNGAVYGPAREADIALSVAQILKKNLEKQTDIQVHMTRNSDQTVPLQDRVDLASQKNSHLLVSLHANASPDQRARGVEFYFQNHLDTDEDAMYLAHLENQLVKEAPKSTTGLEKKSDVLAIVEDLKRQAKMKHSFQVTEKLLKSWPSQQTKSHHAIRQAPFFVVNKAESPAVLVELGFISHPKESQKLLDPDYQKQLAQRLTEGILNYKEMMDKSKDARLQ